MVFIDPTVYYKSHINNEFRSFPAALSEIGRSLQPDLAALFSLFAFQCLPFNKSIDKRIRRVYQTSPNGHLMEGDLYYKKFSRSKFKINTIKNFAKHLVNILLDDLKNNLSKADRITVLLSGGLDSRLVYSAIDYLRRFDYITNEIRVVTWGRFNSVDLEIAKILSTRDGVPWQFLSLSCNDLLKNVKEIGDVLGPLISPVHLHAMPKLCRLNFKPNEVVVAGTLGNAFIQGEYLWRHVNYSRLPVPNDWLGILIPEIGRKGCAELNKYLNDMRKSLRLNHSPTDSYELELLISYNQNLLLFAFDYLRQKNINVYQAFSSERFFKMSRLFFSFFRCKRLSLQCINLLRPDLSVFPTDSSYGKTRLAPSLKPFFPVFHDYGNWTLEKLDEVLQLCTSNQLDNLGIINKKGLCLAAQQIIKKRKASNEASYILLLIASIGTFLENLHKKKSILKFSNSLFKIDYCYEDEFEALPPWGFASRPHDRAYERIPYLLTQHFRSFIK